MGAGHHHRNFVYQDYWFDTSGIRLSSSLFATVEKYIKDINHINPVWTCQTIKEREEFIETANLVSMWLQTYDSWLRKYARESSGKKTFPGKGKVRDAHVIAR